MAIWSGYGKLKGARINLYATGTNKYVVSNSRGIFNEDHIPNRLIQFLLLWQLIRIVVVIYTVVTDPALCSQKKNSLKIGPCTQHTDEITFK